MKAIYIHPGSREVSEVTLPDNDQAFIEMQRLIGNYFDQHRIFTWNDVLNIDEDGTQNPHHTAFVLGSALPFAIFGPAIITGTDLLGNDISPICTLELIQTIVRFLTSEETEQLRKERKKGFTVIPGNLRGN